MTIKDITRDGQWFLDRLWTPISEELANCILSHNLTINDHVEDTVIWSAPLNGIYSARSGYSWLLHHGEPSDVSWNWLWQLKAPENIRFFIWQVCHNSLPTRDILAHRGVPLSATCPLCNSSEEMIIHCLRDCAKAKEVWHGLGLDQRSTFYHDVPIIVWLTTGIKQDINLFLSTIWGVWRNRNVVVFDKTLSPVWEIIHDILSLATLCSQVYGSPPAVRAQRLVKWEPPSLHMIALNTDGSVINNKTGFGGLLWTHTGEWIQGFYGTMGVGDILGAELTPSLLFH
ncbi:Reverse transcriptase zinc-binding domain [Sesbania bispinosa]|nr:Reverse transcriptase zinc-binding domain [Sesbania bispinosa]